MLIYQLSLGSIMKQCDYANGYRLETLPFFLLWIMTEASWFKIMKLVILHTC